MDNGLAVAFRDLVTRLAFEGLSENEIGRARISIMARSDLLHARAGYRSARPVTSGGPGGRRRTRAQGRSLRLRDAQPGAALGEKCRK
jgi:hypothetical protein